MKKALRTAAIRFAVFAIPIIYYLYMTFVWWTSRVTSAGMEKLAHGRVRRRRSIACLWHQDVFFVAYAFREWQGSTLASVGDAGEVIARMLRMCNFEVFRGGSSTGRARRQPVLREMIRHMRTHLDVTYGITVDGSQGPARVLKPGAILIARATGAPLYTVRADCRRKLHLRTWDRTTVPLPFNRIAMVCEGPFFCPPDADREAVEALRQRVERSLADTTDRADRFLGAGVLPPPAVAPDGDYVQPEVRRGKCHLRAEERRSPVPLAGDALATAEALCLTDEEPDRENGGAGGGG